MTPSWMEEPLTYAKTSLFPCATRRTALRPRYSTDSALPPVTERAAVSVSAKVCSTGGAAPGEFWERLVAGANRRSGRARASLPATQRRNAGPDHAVRWTFIFRLRADGESVRGESKWAAIRREEVTH